MPRYSNRLISWLGIVLATVGGASKGAAQAITCDQTITATLSTPTEVDSYTFTFAAGEIVHITVDEIPPSVPSFALLWRVVDSAGNPAADCGSFSGVNDDDCGPLPTGGNPYRIEVKEFDSSDTGTYTIHLQRLTATSACETTTLTCDVVANAAIDNTGETDLFRFTAATGEIVHLTVDELVTSNPDVQWRLLDKNGVPVSPLGTFTGADNADTPALSATLSPYQIEVRDGSQDQTGSYRVHLQRLTQATRCETTAIVCDAVVTASLDTEIDTDLYPLTVAEGEIVHITVDEVSGSVPGFALLWRVLDKNGVAAPDCGAFSGVNDDDCGPLPASGSPYAIEIREFDDTDPGTYTLHVQRMTAAFVCDVAGAACSTPTPGTINPSADTDLFSFGVNEGQSVDITISGAAFDAQWRLVTAGGTPASDCGTFSGASTQNCGPLSTSGNPYRVEVRDGSTDQTGSYNVTVFCTVLGAEAAPGAPAAFELSQNRPNPFNPLTTIQFALPRAEHATLTIYDSAGRAVTTLVDRELDAGVFEVRWNAAGQASGTYYYELRAGTFVQSRKLALLK